MKKTFQNNQLYHWLLLLLIIGLVILKMEALSLPFFWDEAWSYLPAIRKMAEQGPSIMPASIDAELYRGHPLLFYFLSSLWIKIFGYSLPIAHLFPLLISIVLLLSIYYITFSWTNSFFAAFFAAFAVCVQPIFLTQSTFLLSEILLSLLFLWSFWFYFKRFWIPFGITVVMALLTKESAYCLVPAFVLISGVELYFKKINRKEFLANFAIISFLFLVGFSFFIIQKIKLGWLFFPLHTSMIEFSEFGDKMNGCFSILFLNKGRASLIIIAIVAAIYSFIFLKKKLPKEQKIILISFLIFTFGYMLFASINFFSARYLFGAIPLLMIACSFFIGSISKPFYPTILLSFIAIISFINIYTSYQKPAFSDVELNYTRLLKVQVKMVDYLTKNEPKEKLFVTFLMYCILTNPDDGFTQKSFANLSTNVRDSTNVYYINVSNENQPEIEKMHQKKQLKLVRVFEDKQAKIELFKKE